MWRGIFTYGAWDLENKLELKNCLRYYEEHSRGGAQR